jgi:hypothetical protein
MDYAIGIGLALVVSGWAVLVGFDRDRVFYPMVLVVIASYYVLFAVIRNDRLRSSRGRRLQTETMDRRRRVGGSRSVRCGPRHPADKSRRPGMVAGLLSGIRRHGAVEAQCLLPVDVIVRVIEVRARLNRGELYR